MPFEITILQKRLSRKLYHYISENNHDLLCILEETGALSEYLSSRTNALQDMFSQLQKILSPYFIEEYCMDVLTRDLRPSKFSYISAVFEEEFEERYWQLQEAGLLKFEILNLIDKCQTVFDEMHFSEANEDKPFLRYAIITEISKYFDATSECENVMDELQQFTKTPG